MLKSNENMKMKMGGLGTAQSLVGHALSARHQESDLHTLLSQGIERSNKGKQTMKKLMFTAAAALCAAVGFSDVTSANIVG